MDDGTQHGHQLREVGYWLHLIKVKVRILNLSVDSVAL